MDIILEKYKHKHFNFNFIEFIPKCKNIYLSKEKNLNNDNYINLFDLIISIKTFLKQDYNVTMNINKHDTFNNIISNVKKTIPQQINNNTSFNNIFNINYNEYNILSYYNYKNKNIGLFKNNNTVIKLIQNNKVDYFDSTNIEYVNTSIIFEFNINNELYKNIKVQIIINNLHNYEFEKKTKHNNTILEQEFKDKIKQHKFLIDSNKDLYILNAYVSIMVPFNFDNHIESSKIKYINELIKNIEILCL